MPGVSHPSEQRHLARITVKQGQIANYYELWDRQTRNLVDDFDNEGELRAALHEMINLETLALARRDEHGRTEWVGIESFVATGAIA